MQRNKKNDEDDEEEVKEGKRLKILTPNQTASIIRTNKSWKEFIQTKKQNQTNAVLFYQHNKITKILYNNLIKSL